MTFGRVFIVRRPAPLKPPYLATFPGTDNVINSLSVNLSIDLFHVRSVAQTYLSKPFTKFVIVNDYESLVRLIIVVIITWPSEKPPQKSNSDITVIWVSDWFKWLNLFKISSLMSEFSTNKSIIIYVLLFSVCCFQ